MTGSEFYVLEESNPPTADAGPGYSKSEGADLQLYGSNSSDPDSPNSSLKFEWDLNYVGATFDVDVTGDQPIVNFSDNFAPRNIALRVTDPSGLSDIDTTTLFITNADPVIDSLPDTTGQPGTAVSLTANASDPGTADVLTYAWDFGDEQTQEGVNLTAPTNVYAPAGQYTVTLTVTDDDGGSTSDTAIVIIASPVGFATTNQSVDESAGTITATLQLASPATSQVSVPYTVSGSAVGGEDHSLADGTATIAIGQTSVDIVFEVTDDELDELDTETAIITLGTPTGASLGAASTHKVTIADNDAKPQVSFATAFQRVQEDFGATASVAVRLDRISGRDVVVPLSVSGTATSGVDYTIDSTSITIPAGQLTADTIVSLINDTDPESAEIVQVELLASDQAIPASSAGAALTHSVTISQNDAVQAWFDVSTRGVQEGSATPAFLNVRLSKASASDVTIPITLSGDSAEVTMNPADGMLVIPAGQTAGYVTLTAVDDAARENTKTVVATIGSPTGAIRGPVTEAVTYVYDNEISTASLTTLSPATMFESGGPIDVRVQLDRPSPVDLTFQINGGVGAPESASFTEDYTIGTSTVTIPAGQLTADTTVQLIDDTDHELTETLRLNLVVPGTQTSGGFRAVQYGNSRSLEFSIRDNDPWIRILNEEGSVGEGDGATTFGILVDGDAESPIDVSYVVSGSASR